MSEITEIDSKIIQSYLSFRLSNELFAVDVSKVIEILEIPKITRVPKVPEYMAGVINLRGNVLPLVDTRIKFGLPKIEFTKDTCIVVIEIEIEGEMIHAGALVDAVLEVMEVDENTIQPSPSIDTKYPLDFIRGMIHADENFVMLLNIDEVFSMQEKEVLKLSTETKQKSKAKTKKNSPKTDSGNKINEPTDSKEATKKS